MAKILLLGGTGALGNYLVDELAGSDHDVFVTSRKEHHDYQNIHFIRGNAKTSRNFLDSILEEHFDCIVDFMVWNSSQFNVIFKNIIENTGHYIYLSSYRVYADNGLSALTEESPLLLDTSKDEEYLKTDEYALAKAREERILTESGYGNYTIVRPAITFSKTRFQLGTLEASVIIPRTVQHRPVLMPEEILNKRAAVSWAGDVGRMFAAILGNDRAKKEIFNVATSESHTWRTIADYYKELAGTRVVTIPLSSYLKIVRNQYQVRYDRMYDRVIDNSKILHLMHLTQEDLTPIKEGLRKELADIQTLAGRIEADTALCKKMDKQLYIHHPFIGMQSRFMPALFSRKNTPLPDSGHKPDEHLRKKSFVSPVIADFKRNTPSDHHGKAGILDHSFINNHGTVLASFALKTMLESLGYKTEFINYKPISVSASPAFLSFRGKYLSPLSRRFNNLEEFKEAAGEWSYVVTGAGPVWGPKNTDVYMLAWLSGRCSLISYASSFGYHSYAGAIPPSSASSLLKRYDALSVRDASAKEICRRCFNIDAEHVIDPVFLLERRDYEKLSETEKTVLPEEPYVCVLFMNDSLKCFLNNNNILLSIRSRYKVIDGCRMETGAFRSIPAWLSCIKNAKFIITDFFYGAAFSCIFNKQFAFIDSGIPGEIDAINDMFDDFNISKSHILPSLYSVDIDIFHDRIDYESINQYISDRKNTSILFITHAFHTTPSIKPVYSADSSADTKENTYGTELNIRHESTVYEDWKNTYNEYTKKYLGNKNEEHIPENRHKNKAVCYVKYKSYKLLSKIFHGKKREKYKEKSNKYKILSKK